jgi:hypothetical protein
VIVARNYLAASARELRILLPYPLIALISGFLDASLRCSRWRVTGARVQYVSFNFEQRALARQAPPIIADVPCAPDGSVAWNCQGDPVSHARLSYGMTFARDAYFPGDLRIRRGLAGWNRAKDVPDPPLKSRPACVKSKPDIGGRASCEVENSSCNVT